MSLVESNVSLYTSTMNAWYGLHLTSLISNLVANMTRLFPFFSFDLSRLACGSHSPICGGHSNYFSLSLSFSLSAFNRSSFASVQL
jgi:hypothetical protein